MIKKIVKSILFGFVSVLAGIVMLYIVCPFINNGEAKKVLNVLLSCDLPQQTILLDNVSAAGKLVGNGNGMQYFGAILIRSNLSEEELRDYYKELDSEEYHIIVEKQESNAIEVIENARIFFDEANDYKDAYIVYSWGNYSGFASEWDIRGHL